MVDGIGGTHSLCSPQLLGIINHDNAVADNYAHQSHNAQKARNTEINALDDDTGCRSEQT